MANPDEIGKALLSNKAGQLGFVSCDMFELTEETTALQWPKEASTSDAMLLAGVLILAVLSGAWLVACAIDAAGSGLGLAGRGPPELSGRDVIDAGDSMQQRSTAVAERARAWALLAYRRAWHL